MRIVIDLQGAQTASRVRGIGRYSLAFAQALARNRREHEVVIALSGLLPEAIDSIRAALDGLLPQDNVRIWDAPGPVKESDPENRWRRESAELIREAFLASLRPDILHVSSLFEGFLDDAVTSIKRLDFGIPTSVSLYDLIPLVNEKDYQSTNPDYVQHYRRKLEYLQRANCLFAISEFTRQEAIRLLGTADDSIVTVYSAADERFRKISVSDTQVQHLGSEFKITRPFILNVGAGDARKNLARLIRTFSMLSPELRKQHQLVLAGQFNPNDLRRLRSEANSAGLQQDELIFVGHVSEEDLVLLYNQCRLFVFPSLQEGFGLPPLEAMKCGAPVIASDASSLPEVIGWKDAQFDPHSTTSIAMMLWRALSNSEFRTDLIQNGEVQGPKFSWDMCAIRAIAAFERMHITARGTSVQRLSDERIHTGLISALADSACVANIPDKSELMMCCAAVARNLPIR